MARSIVNPLGEIEPPVIDPDPVDPTPDPDPEPTPPEGVVVLDIALFRELYPMYANASDAQIEYWWQLANIVIDNTPGSSIPYAPPSVTTRKVLLYLLMCHFATLDARGPGAVGRVTQAAEGSVNGQISSALDQSKQAAWWMQSQCGAMAWEILKKFRVGGLYFHGGCKY